MMAVYGNLSVLDDAAGDRLHRRYVMPSGAAEVLTDRHSLSYLGALPQMLAAVGLQIDKLLEAYSSGGGVSWAQLGDNARDSQAALNRPWFESALAPALASVPEIDAALQAPGTRIADIGCGAGWSTIVLARAYSSATVLGVDVDEPSIQAAMLTLKLQVLRIERISPRARGDLTGARPVRCRVCFRVRT
jgi:2-polyprenyl-3-methyl-5-hydroxy-6-metoxy-1,4-benzoquinol methylase